MDKPKEILELERIYGIELKAIDEKEFSWQSRNSYVINTNGEITHLNLSKNQISEIKGLETIIKREKFNNLRIDNNPFLKDTPLILKEYENHLADLLNYFSIEEQTKVSVSLPAKVMLVGNHAAGKSTFWHYMKENELPKEAPGSTHVLQVHPYPAERPAGQLPDAMVYDFGGQDYYHGLYQAFLSEDSVNVLFWCNESNDNDPRKAQDGSGRYTRIFKLEYWLHQLKYAFERRKEQWGTGNLHESDEPLLIVQTHADSPGDKRKNCTEDLSEFNVEGEYYLSLNKESVQEGNSFHLGLQYLKATLLQKIKDKKQTEERGEYYKKFLQYVLNAKGHTCIPVENLISEGHYGRELLDEEKEDEKKKEEKEKEKLLMFLKSDLYQLHLRGLALYYRENKKLEDVVWLNPTKTVAHIHQKILSPSVMRNKAGILSEEDFHKATKGDDKIEQLLICEKVVFHDKYEDKYIIPGYLPLVSEDAYYDMLRFGFAKPNFILKFKRFIPFGLINQLICLYGRNPDKKKFWRDQLIFTLNGSYKIWIKLDFSELTIAVSIHPIPEKQRSTRFNLNQVEQLLFYNIIDLYWGKEVRYETGKEHEPIKEPIKDNDIQQITEYIRSYKIKSPEDMYISVDGERFVLHTELEAFDNSKHLTIPAYSFKEGKETHKTQQVSAYKNFTKNLNIKGMKKIFISYSRKDVDYKNELKKHLDLLKTFEIADTWSCEEISIGKWDAQIQKELEESDLIIYMLSANFFSSKYILENEVKKGLEDAAQNSDKVILCVVVSEFVGLEQLRTTNPNPLQDAILQLADWQYLPYDTKPNKVTGKSEEKITSLTAYPQSRIDEAFVQIVNKIVEKLKI
ncbi:MAG: TIR domain-containing protein [Tannerella sp.]|nr:TIR domain-containing protein [Tannerella sp.]